MVSIPEILTWIIGVVVLLFGIVQYQYVQRLPDYVYLVVSYSAMLIAWTVTILEGFFWENFLNTLEHGFQLVSVIMLSVWCYRIVRQARVDA